jgi:hypothetical protein
MTHIWFSFKHILLTAWRVSNDYTTPWTLILCFTKHHAMDSKHIAPRTRRRWVVRFMIRPHYPRYPVQFQSGRHFRMTGNRALRRIFGPKREEVAGGWWRLNNEQLHNLYISLNITRVIKSRRMWWAEQVEEKPEGKRPFERTILIWNLKRYILCGLESSGSGQRPVAGSCEYGNEHSGHINSKRNFLTNWSTMSFSTSWSYSNTNWRMCCSSVCTSSWDRCQAKWGRICCTIWGNVCLLEDNSTDTRVTLHHFS